MELALARTFQDMKKLADKVEIVAVCDIDEAKLERASKRYGVSETFTDYREMLKNEGAGCSERLYPELPPPSHQHRCIRAGKHVLCEKALALNAEQERRDGGSSRKKPTNCS